MNEIPLFCRRFHAINERKAEALERDDLPRHNDAIQEHRTMPFEHYVDDDSPRINQNEQETWQPVGAIARMLVERAAAAGVDLTSPSVQTETSWNEIADKEGLPCFEDIARDVSEGFLK